MLGSGKVSMCVPPYEETLTRQQYLLAVGIFRFADT